MQVQQEIIHEVRSIYSMVPGAPQDEYDLIFTSNTTEAINLAAETELIRSSGEDNAGGIAVLGKALIL